MIERSIQKFLPVKDGNMLDAMTLNQITSKGLDCDMCLQCTGFKDANNDDVYEGAVIELRITDELMDHSKNTFYNSNLGRAMEKDRDIKSVICLINNDNKMLHCGYEVYFMYTDGIKDDGDTADAVGSDTMFPSYLCAKGAVIIGNQQINSDIKTNILKYSKWNK